MNVPVCVCLCAGVLLGRESSARSSTAMQVQRHGPVGGPFQAGWGGGRGGALGRCFDFFWGGAHGQLAAPGVGLGTEGGTYACLRSRGRHKPTSAWQRRGVSQRTRASAQLSPSSPLQLVQPHSKLRFRKGRTFALIDCERYTEIWDCSSIRV